MSVRAMELRFRRSKRHFCPLENRCEPMTTISSKNAVTDTINALVSAIRIIFAVCSDYVLPLNVRVLMILVDTWGVEPICF